MNSKSSRFAQILLEEKAQMLVIFGTSLSYHLAPMMRRELCARFGEKVKVINAGLAGRASRTGLGALQEKVLSSGADTILMEWAINDAHDYHHELDALDAGITLEESGANLNELIWRIQTFLPRAEIILWTTNPTFDTPTSSMRGASARPLLAQYYEGVRSVASARGLKLIDAEKFWNSTRATGEDAFRVLFSEGVHPTPFALRDQLVPFLLDEFGIPART